MNSKQNRQPLTRDEFDELVKRAEIGSAEALSELRALIRADPTTWRQFGNLTEHIKLEFLNLMVHGNVVARESLSLELDELTRELRQGNQSPLRKLIIDQILILWLDVHYQQTMATQTREKKASVEFFDRRLEKTRKRYFDALESLGKMDKVLGLTPSPTATKPKGSTSKPPPAPPRGVAIPTSTPLPDSEQHGTYVGAERPAHIRSDLPTAPPRPTVIPTMIPQQLDPARHGSGFNDGTVISNTAPARPYVTVFAAGIAQPSAPLNNGTPGDRVGPESKVSPTSTHMTVTATAIQPQSSAACDSTPVSGVGPLAFCRTTLVDDASLIGVKTQKSPTE